MSNTRNKDNSQQPRRSSGTARKKRPGPASTYNLKESEAIYSILAENTMLGITWMSQTGGFLRANDSFCRLVGYSAEELCKMSFQDITHPDDLGKELALLKQLVEGEISCYQTEKRFITRNKGIIWVNISVTFHRIRGKEEWFSIGVIEDITERKEVLEALRTSETRLKLAQDFANAGNWEWDLSTNENYWSDRIWELYGLDPNSCRPSYEAWKSTIHPDDLQKTEQAVLEAARNLTELNIEWRVNNQEGRGRWLMSRGRPLFNSMGKPIKYVGIVIDISERRLAEDARRASLDRYRSYIEVTGQLGWTTNAVGEVVEDLPSWRAYTGQSPDEIKGWGWSKALHPDDLEQTTWIWKNAVEKKSNYEVEYRIRRHDGVYRYFMARGIPVLREDGAIREWVGTCIDITELREASEVMRRAKEDLANAVLNRTEELKKINEELEKEKAQINITNILLELFVQNISLKDYLELAVDVIRKWSGCCCVGVRILDENGNLPYVASTGFSQEFLDAENLLSVNKDQCACIRLSTQHSDQQEMPGLTRFGSFYTNNTSIFLDGLTDPEKSRFKDLCVGSGFRSVAVIPVRYQKKVLGVIHLADHLSGMVSAKTVAFIETLSHIMGGAVYKYNAAEELKESRQQLRNLATHMQEVREHERTTIAREIHDELGQILTAIKMDLVRINEISGDHEEVLQKSGAMISLVSTAIQAVKRITTELRPGTLDYLSISEAIEWQAEEFEKRSGISCETISIPEEIILDKSISINIFRIFQEIMTNIVNHSKATEVSVTLEKTGGLVKLHIRDNGKGISDAEVSRPTSFGIIGMRERVHFMGGEMKIKGVRGKGTEITVTIPI